MTKPDLRTKGFQNKTPLAVSLDILLNEARPLPSDDCQSQRACGRVLADDVVCPRPVPSFNRSAMDGFAVRSADIRSVPVSLRVIGSSFPGSPHIQAVETGTATRVMTGAAVPDGADAVVPVEHCSLDGATVSILATTQPGKHVCAIGEDFRPGQIVLRAGHRLRAHDLAALSALGIGRVHVVRRPSISIILTGNELLPAFSIPESDKICDANSPMLRELANRDGAGSILIETVHDHHEALASVLVKQTTRDVVLVSGGSSVGLEDHAPDVLSRVGTLEVHGLALRPASPAGFGRLASGTRVFLLPGNPVSCLCAYELLAGRLIRRLGGHCDDLPHKTVRLPLGAPLISASGRTDFARIRVHDEKAFPLAISGAGMLSTVVLADGFVIIPPESEILQPGELVTVHLF